MMRSLLIALLLIIALGPAAPAQQQSMTWWLVVVTDVAVETRFLSMLLGPYPSRRLCDDTLSAMRGSRNLFGDPDIRIVSTSCKSQIEVGRLVLNP